MRLKFAREDLCWWFRCFFSFSLASVAYGAYAFAVLNRKGALAQLVEHLHGMQRVSGSNPLRSTIFYFVERWSLFSKMDKWTRTGLRPVFLSHSNLTSIFFPLFFMLTGQDLAIACARAADDVKADDVRVFDLRGISTLTDFMVVCAGNSMPHLKAIVRDVEGNVREQGADSALHTEGKAASRWVVIDFVDVMVHVLDEEFREHYALESLWGDAKEVVWNSRDED